jgi:hypothetical protein
MKQPAQSERGPNAILPCLNRLNDAPPYFIPPRKGPQTPNAQAPPRPLAGFAKTSGAVAPGSAPAESRGSESRGIKVLIPLSERALGINYGYADLYYCYIQEMP